MGRYVNPVNGARLMHSQKPRVSSVLIAVAVQWWCTCRYKVRSVSLRVETCTALLTEGKLGCRGLTQSHKKTKLTQVRLLITPLLQRRADAVVQ